jgi:mRNA interferase HigB
MRVISRRHLAEFWARHPDSEEPLQAWYAVARRADWAGPAALKAQYGSASILGGNRCCFNIGGNKYRLVVKINYPYRVVYVRFVGTHAEYDRIDALTI